MLLCLRAYVQCFMSFPEHANKEKSISKSKGVPLWIRASFTLEAAIVIPFVTAFLVAILFFFRIMQVQLEVQEALEQAARATAALERIAEDEGQELAVAELYFRSHIHNANYAKNFVFGGEVGISLISSTFSGEFIDLHAVYRIPIPVPLVQIQGIPVCQSTRCRKWIGDCIPKKEEKDPYVYVTETGKVYHLTDKCSYLDLSIQKVKSAELKDLRNKNEHKYKECTQCVAKNTYTDYVYITDYGTCYHVDIACSGLKRTIYCVRLSQVEDKSLCTKCEAKRGEQK